MPIENLGIKQSTPDYLPSNKKELYTKVFSSEQYNSVCIKAVRKEYYPTELAGFKNVRYGEDLLQTIEILKHNPRTVFISEVLYYYRTNLQSLTHSLKVEQYALDIVMVRNEVYELLKNENIYNVEDYYRYRGICIRLLANGVANIARCKCSYKIKTKLFKSMKDCSYYRDFLLAEKFDTSFLGNRLIIWWFFKHGLYFLIVFIMCGKRLFN